MHRRHLSVRGRAEVGVQEISASNNISDCEYTVWARAEQICAQAGGIWVRGQDLRERITKPEREINKSCSEIERPWSWIKIGKKAPYVFTSAQLSEHTANIVSELSFWQEHEVICLSSSRQFILYYRTFFFFSFPNKHVVVLQIYRDLTWNWPGMHFFSLFVDIFTNHKLMIIHHQSEYFIFDACFTCLLLIFGPSITAWSKYSSHCTVWTSALCLIGKADSSVFDKKVMYHRCCFCSRNALSELAFFLCSIIQPG